jgi:predicted CoA-binding protein
LLTTQTFSRRLPLGRNQTKPQAANFFMSTIAIIGASANRAKFGNRAVRAYHAKGYKVFPIHPSASSIEGLPVYHSITQVPATILDRVSIYLPASVGLKVLDEVAAKPAREVWLNPGADDPQVVRRARELGLNVIVGCSIVDIGVNPHSLH